MMIIRLVLLLALFVFLIPKDFIVQSLPYIKLTYHETLKVVEKFRFEEIEAHFTMDTAGCDIELLNKKNEDDSYFVVEGTYGIFIKGHTASKNSF